jgi:eukaryotic-like serine/threonine-protein kinase
MDRAGKATGTLSDVASYFSLALSPDEKQVVVVLTSGSPENRDVYVVDVARDQSMRLTTDPGFDFSPVWSPDGLRIAFIAYTQGAGPSGDVWVMPLGGNRQPFPVAQTAALETSGRFSPDGRWLAYMSNEGRRREIYVQPFPPDGRRHQVSRNGGSHPVWRGDGKELFYLREPDGMLMAVPIPTGTPSWDPGAEQELFNPGAVPLNPSQQYAPTRDGKRFLVNRRPQRASAEPLTVILTWPATVQK